MALTTLTLACKTCGHRTLTRTALGHGDYQEFAFPCGGCGLEIRYGMKLPLNKRMARVMAGREKHGEDWFVQQLERLDKMRQIVLTNLSNAKLSADLPEATDVRTVDGETLNPVNQQAHFSPFLATVWLPKNRDQFSLHQHIRQTCATKYAAQIQKLRVHFERKQWALFDKQLEELNLGLTVKTEAEKASALFYAAEQNGQAFRPANDKFVQQIKQRIALAESTSPPLVTDLANFFQAKQNKDEAIARQLWAIRESWGPLHEFLHPIYNIYYWDNSKRTLDDYTLAQKRFDELKQFYIDCFETFCRVSSIAAGVEGIILKNSVGVPTPKRLMPLEEFDTAPNGLKADILKSLVVADIFVPFIDHNLRNGIGHHSAHYEVKTDTVHYVTENKTRGVKQHKISYIRFCEKVVRLYAQVETVSLYAHWLRNAAFK